jgi:hypothetical protein
LYIGSKAGVIVEDVIEFNAGLGAYAVKVTALFEQVNDSGNTVADVPSLGGGGCSSEQSAVHD